MSIRVAKICTSDAANHLFWLPFVLPWKYLVSIKKKNFFLKVELFTNQLLNNVLCTMICKAVTFHFSGSALNRNNVCYFKE